MKKILLNSLALLALSSSGWAQSPYINKIYDFCPAPGQFVGDMPTYEPGDTKVDMIKKVEECICNDARVIVSLGSFGGYIVFGFDHAIENKPGMMDFEVLGNAFYSNANTKPNANKGGGSCEPGIVMVSRDANNNGLPDDEWYELAGSEYRKPTTIHNYRITYFRPDAKKEATPDPNNTFICDTSYVRWRDNQGGEGHVYRNVYHSQSYFPEWLEADSLTFEGTLLPDNYIDESGTGSYYVQYAYSWGYADNHPNNNDRCKFNIEWAVDNEGNAVNLESIDFIKVYTGVNQYCGWLGETSTELMGACDLHLLGRATEDTTPINSLHGEYSAENRIRYYDLNGRKVESPTLPGIYIEHSNQGSRKILVR